MSRRAAVTSRSLVFLAAILVATAALAAAGPEDWRREFPKTDFSNHSIPFSEIISGGPRRDTIPPIDNPRFVPVHEAAGIGPREPVVSVAINGDFRAYPLRILLWHEIVNDVVGGVPVAVTYCPLCNSGVVFDRRLDGLVLDFGNTGRLRRYDMVMYDRQTESWWQQFLGEAMIGALTGKRLKMLPARLESLARFRARAPKGKILVPGNNRARPYGTTPYVGMDGTDPAVLRQWAPSGDVAPLARVVVVGGEAWTLDLVRRKRKIVRGDLVITWLPGQNSLHDKKTIADGRDVGNVVVQRRTAKGLVDEVYDVSFAFAFHAFHPKATIHTE